MIVRDAGEAWQVVLQTDHAELSGAFARAWAREGTGSGADSEGSGPDSLAIAADRHDDGWAVWEQAPRVDEAGKPVNFLEVDVRSHLAFYRAGIAAITEQDPHAGLLVSMHGAGIYRERYGLDPGLGLARAAEAQEEVDAFVAEQETKFGGSPGKYQREYELLQLYDRLSLYFCMRDVEKGEASEFQGYRLEPVAPWHVRMEPYPFGSGSPARFSLLRRVLPKNGGADDILAATPERLQITIEP